MDKLMPVKHFKNDKQLKEYLDYWINKLFLTDWTIKARLEPFYSPNLECSNLGVTRVDHINRAAFIFIATGTEEMSGEDSQTICEEETLIHELLHCKEEYFQSLKEDNFTDIKNHSNLEQMAKSLLMTKYNLSFDYFKAE